MDKVNWTWHRGQDQQTDQVRITQHSGQEAQHERSPPTCQPLTAGVDPALAQRALHHLGLPVVIRVALATDGAKVPCQHINQLQTKLTKMSLVFSLAQIFTPTNLKLRHAQHQQHSAQAYNVNDLFIFYFRCSPRLGYQPRNETQMSTHTYTHVNLYVWFLFRGAYDQTPTELLQTLSYTLN